MSCFRWTELPGSITVVIIRNCCERLQHRTNTSADFLKKMENVLSKNLMNAVRGIKSYTREKPEDFGGQHKKAGFMLSMQRRGMFTAMKKKRKGNRHSTAADSRSAVRFWRDPAVTSSHIRPHQRGSLCNNVIGDIQSGGSRDGH